MYNYYENMEKGLVYSYYIRIVDEIKPYEKITIKNMIEEVLDSLPESYDDDLWPKTCSEVYMHIFEKYPGQGQSPYAH